MTINKDYNTCTTCSGYEWACFQLMEEYMEAKNKRISLDSAPRELKPEWKRRGEQDGDI